ncbi:hypothetical protein [Trebonia sp.]|uniref:hypothetical protein n=1 Tax=Trebonia sp. TaxID=2767075 RepID=UPI0026192328|nr:hypothetical protein [Trebonia sp.]
MRVPQVNERVKDAPANTLRAMFAGIGQLLSITDKFRNKSAAAPADTVAPETAVPEAAAPQSAAPETAAPETAVPETAVPETAVPETAVPETAVPETAVGGHVKVLPTEAAAAAGEPPVPNYDSLSVASLRARLRNLTPAELGQLIEYEKGHAGRADVITMFERRIAKLAEE